MKANVILNALRSQVWAIHPAALQRMIADLELLGEAEVSVRPEAAQPSPRSITGGVAVIPVYGSISHRASLWSMFFGGTSTQRLSNELSGALADPAVSRIVLDVDSPGGTVDGVMEVVNEIFEARDRKPITAVANAQAASSAYWIASQASELVVTPSGEVGSIGVFALHADFSKALEMAGIKTTFIKAGKYKTEGNSYEPLSEEAREYFQSRVDSYHSDFVKAVARGRGVTADKVRHDFGQGRMVGADEAVSKGMADKVMTLGTAIGRRGSVVSGARAENDEVPVVADDGKEEIDLRRRRLRRHRLA